jgi:hypothetical protein
MQRARTPIALQFIEDQIKDHLEIMIDSECRLALTIQQYSDDLNSLYQRWQQDTSTGDPSLEALVNSFRVLRGFNAELRSATLESLSQRIAQISDAVVQEFPTQRAMVKLRKSKTIRAFESERRFNLDHPLQFLYGFTVRWLRFWDSLLEMLPREAPERRICERARSGFARFQRDQGFRQAAETYQDQIEQLRRATKGADGDFAFLNDIKLHYCAPGNILSGTVDAPVKSQSLLFLFEKSVVLMRTRDRSVIHDAILNFWMLRSPMFAGAKVVEVLGTQFSFPFETPETEALLKAWASIGLPIPIDFGIFQSIALAAETREPDWIEVDQ